MRRTSIYWMVTLRRCPGNEDTTKRIPPVGAGLKHVVTVHRSILLSCC